MIRPTKYLDLNSCVLRVAAEILSILRDEGAVPLDELDGRVRRAVGNDARFTFLPGMSLLFLLGRMDYDGQTDTVVPRVSSRPGGP